MAVTNIDIDRCREAMKGLTVEGICGSGIRGIALAEAIAAIQTDPENALKARYIGVKNYAGFGDQREDHEYGYGPKHGYIVFSIRRRDIAKLGADHIYLLECARDFPGHGVREWSSGTYREFKLSLCELIARFDKASAEAAAYRAALNQATFESHDAGVAA